MTTNTGLNASCVPFLIPTARPESSKGVGNRAFRQIMTNAHKHRKEDVIYPSSGELEYDVAQEITKAFLLMI